MDQVDVIEITPELTLAELFRERVLRTPDAIAYKHFDWGRRCWIDTSWRQMSLEVGRWQQAMLKMGLEKGDRVAMMLRNGREWVIFDQAALGLGLITVPLFVDDRPGNATHILRESGAKLIVLAGRLQWRGILENDNNLPALQQIISVTPISQEDMPDDSRLESLGDWLFGLEGELQTEIVSPDDAATIVFTSGTTGKPKGVVLSHRNILLNARNGLYSCKLCDDELFLSFLPLSHMFERTVGYYLPIMCGYTVAFARSIQQLGEDLRTLRPTCLVSVPRIYEKIYSRIQSTLSKESVLKRFMFILTYKVGYRRMLIRSRRKWWSPDILLWPLLNKLVASKVNEKLGGRIRVALCGGAALSKDVDKFFSGLGFPLMQGYGLTESSPIISVNEPGQNKLGSVGKPIRNTEVRISDEGELQTYSDSVMKGYWKDEVASAAMFTNDGWLKTGDLARIDEEGFIYLTGRIKEILVLSNGEKVPPGDMETAICLDSLFEQAIVIGDGRPSLAALVVLNNEKWEEYAAEEGFDVSDENILEQTAVRKRIVRRIASNLTGFPGYAQVREVYLTLEPWTIENDLLTPTMKMKRSRLMERYKNEIAKLFLH